MEPQSPSKSKLGAFKSYRIMKSCFIFIAFLVVSVGIVYGFGKLGKMNQYFTVVVDCGSTGTRVNVYEWRINGERNEDLPDLLHSYPDDLMKSNGFKDGCRYHCMQTEPGLDKFVGNYSGVRVSLDPLIHWAEMLVPRERHSDTPIFVLATAGLRRVPVEDASLVLEDVARVVGEYSFRWKRDWIRVLSGREEAYYGWVALNYKMGYLKNSTSLPTLGLLDLGGSSLQAVIETDGVRQDSHLLVSKVGAAVHQLMAYSLPAFGVNKAFDRTVNLVKLMGNDVNAQVRHPCLSLGFIGNYSCSGCSSPESLVHLVGDPNWEKCKIIVWAAATNSSISDWSEPRFDSSCKAKSANDGKNVLNVAFVTDLGVRYHALSGFYAVYSMLNLTAKANWTKVWEKAQYVCSNTWDNPSVSGSKNCFKVLYLASLIRDGLCLGNADIIFGPGDISWTLGASLVEGELMWKTSGGLRNLVTTSYYITVLPSPVILFIILVVLLFIVYHSQVKLPMPQKRSGGVRAALSSYTRSKR